MVVHGRMYDREGRPDGEWFTTPEVVLLDATRGEVVTVGGVYELGGMARSFKRFVEARMGHDGVFAYDHNYPDDHMGAAVQDDPSLYSKPEQMDHAATLHPTPDRTEMYVVTRAAGLRTDVYCGLETVGAKAVEPDGAWCALYRNMCLPVVEYVSQGFDDLQMDPTIAAAVKCIGPDHARRFIRENPRPGVATERGSFELYAYRGFVHRSRDPGRERHTVVLMVMTPQDADGLSMSQKYITSRALHVSKDCAEFAGFKEDLFEGAGVPFKSLRGIVDLEVARLRQCPPNGQYGCGGLVSIELLPPTLAELPEYRFFHLGMIRVTTDSVKVLTGQCMSPRGPTPNDMKIASQYTYGGGKNGSVCKDGVPKESYVTTLHRLGEELATRELLLCGWSDAHDESGRLRETRSHWDRMIQPLMDKCGVSRVTSELMVEAFTECRPDGSWAGSPIEARAATANVLDDAVE